MDFSAVLMTLITNVGSFGILTWVTSAIFIEWKKRSGRDLDNNQKRLITAATSIGIISVAYLLGVLLKFWVFDWETLGRYVQVILTELGGAFGIFTATKAAQSSQEVKLGDGSFPRGDDNR